jgi:exodeoxyribonuclease VII large subunit
VLARGYSLAYGPDGGLLRRADAVKPGDAVRVRLASGGFAVRVESVHSE